MSTPLQSEGQRIFKNYNLHLIWSILIINPIVNVKTWHASFLLVYFTIILFFLKYVMLCECDIRVRGRI